MSEQRYLTPVVIYTACPSCGAQKNQRCHRGPDNFQPHPARLEAYTKWLTSKRETDA